MIVMTVHAKVSPSKEEEFLQMMCSLSSDPDKQQGFGKRTLWQQIDDPTSFSLNYEWETREDLERYLTTEKFRVLLGAIEVLSEKSKISYGKQLEDLPDIETTYERKKDQSLA